MGSGAATPKTKDPVHQFLPMEKSVFPDMQDGVSELLQICDVLATGRIEEMLDEDRRKENYPAIKFKTLQIILKKFRSASPSRMSDVRLHNIWGLDVLDFFLVTATNVSMAWSIASSIYLIIFKSLNQRRMNPTSSFMHDSHQPAHTWCTSRRRLEIWS